MELGAGEAPGDAESYVESVRRDETVTQTGAKPQEDTPDGDGSYQYDERYVEDNTWWQQGDENGGYFDENGYYWDPYHGYNHECNWEGAREDDEIVVNDEQNIDGDWDLGQPSTEAMPYSVSEVSGEATEAVWGSSSSLPHQPPPPPPPPPQNF
jgi:hypothetical protein